jgi:phage gp16-like protein
MQNASPDTRRRLIAAIHVEAARRGLDDDARRAMQRRLTGLASCAEMDDAQLRVVLDALRGRRAGADRAPLLRKVHAMLGDRPVAYAEGILKRMYGDRAPQRLEWATPQMLRAVVAALAYDRRRHAH